MKSFDVVVVGGGHAGIEAAAAAARLGVSVALVTPDLERIGQLSCNPAMGGVAKGVVIREIDALGGVMGRATDASRIQFRMLNRSKGPAVWGPRAQCDRGLYPRASRRILEELPGVTFLQGTVAAPRLEGTRIAGVRLGTGEEIATTRLVVTAGTFLRGRLHVGLDHPVPGGRAGEAPSEEFAGALEELGLRLRRFKTGTPARVDGRTVDYDKVEEQWGDPEEYRFSFHGKEELPEQRPCWISWTGEPLKRIVRENLGRSAVFGGAISGRGPRYCPSIEDKVVRFPDAERHQVFLEPEGLNTSELYVNGVSSSLPPEVQEAFLRTIPGLEEVRMTRAGYAVEYDYLPPEQLHPTLAVRGFEGLYLAGQVNGTTGYEEAGGQGIIAGANAALSVKGAPSFTIERDEGYIGVLIDDLISKGVDEPYRLFTSRAEFRLLLRQDNALGRLGGRAREIGLLTEDQAEAYEERVREEDRIRRWFGSTVLSVRSANDVLAGAGDRSPVREPVKAEKLVRRPHVGAEAVWEAGDGPGSISPDLVASIELELKYAGYVEKERARAEVLRRQSEVRIPDDVEWETVLALSHEARQKLSERRPETLAAAGRIPGVSPADLQNLYQLLGKWRAAPVSRETGRG